MKRGSFKVPIYECRVYVTLTSTLDQGVAMLPKPLYEAMQGYDPTKAAYYAASPDTSDYATLFTKDSLDAGVVSHEVLHVAEKILQDIGYVPRKGRTDEPLAYLLRWLTDRVHKILYK